jgi:hypothetical protein
LQFTAYSPAVTGHQVPKYFIDLCNHRFEVALEFVNQHLNCQDIRSCSAFKKAGNVIRGGCGVFHDDFRTFTVSSV